jgi:recombination protein RecR
MINDAEPIRRLIAAFKKLPGIGEKTALRLAYHVLKSSQEQAEELAHALTEIKTRIALCESCFTLTDRQPCVICDDPQRSDETICVVEQPADTTALEKTGAYKGKYHVLHGALSPLDDIGPDELKIAELVERIGKAGTKEIIVATNPTREGEATAAYLADRLKPLGVRVTRIAHGISMGADIEYTDEVTLNFAMNGRREL